ncbi:MAG: imidazole glycerol phosphate synthase subunit HisH [Ignavibacteria bacterium]|nr:imidazole glycerol phosphate synthase subunit HisH [Ignavibacteria bacterium]
MIGIIDYGAGNVASVTYSLERLHQKFVITNDVKILEQCERIIFPGVGYAKSAMEAIDREGVGSYLQSTSKPVLGICLGMQLLGEYSDEGDTTCLGVIPFHCKKFNQSGLKVPNMGWCRIHTNEESSPLFAGIPRGAYFYFAHSFFVPVTENSIAFSEHGSIFTAAVQKNNYYGVQFHPEKSAEVGEALLRNFIEIC